MSDTVQEAREALTLRHILDEIHSHFMRVAREVGNSEALLEVAERQWTETADAYAAAARAEGAAEERVRLVALIASEECAHDLAHTVDDVNPRKTHTGDQEDAAIYCRHIAKYLAALTGADK